MFYFSCATGISGRSVFFSLDVTAQQRLNGFSSNVHKMTSLQRYSLMVVPHENPPPKWGLKTSISRAKI